MSDPYFQSPGVTLYHGDCLDVLRELPDASVDAVVTDPPYGLEFMGKEWDAPWKADGTVLADPASVGGFQDGNGGNPYSRSRVRFGVGVGFQQWCELWAAECLRVLKPGGHLLAFGGTRTFHRLACAVEDAGFEIRDSIAWLYGSGFPKSLDVSKAIDKKLCIEAGTHTDDPDHNCGREVVGAKVYAEGATVKGRMNFGGVGDKWRWGSEWLAWDDLPPEALRFYESTAEVRMVTAPATDAAREWQGWGTALKPAFEPVVVARKPLQGTVAANVQAFGTGALNIDECRIGETVETWPKSPARPLNSRDMHHNYVNGGSETVPTGDVPSGRWPANVVLDESQAAALDEQSGEQRDGWSGKNRGFRKEYVGGEKVETDLPEMGYGGGGGASRFFYTAKADAGERVRVDGIAHPTVKPLSLMRWLVRLVTPPGGTVLEPFAGSGTTVEACILEGFQCIAIEREADYLPLIVQRVNRQRDPIAYTRTAGEDLGLFDIEEPA